MSAHEERNSLSGNSETKNFGEEEDINLHEIPSDSPHNKDFYNWLLASSQSHVTGTHHKRIPKRNNSFTMMSHDDEPIQEYRKHPKSDEGDDKSKKLERNMLDNWKESEENKV